MTKKEKEGKPSSSSLIIAVVVTRSRCRLQLLPLLSSLVAVTVIVVAVTVVVFVLVVAAITIIAALPFLVCSRHSCHLSSTIIAPLVAAAFAHERCHRHRHLSSAGAANSHLKLSSPPLVFLNRPLLVAVDRLSSLLP
jgi:hypothetical protein